MRFTVDKTTPIRNGADYGQRWNGSDRGLIAAWERGRELATDNPDLSAKALQGELVPLPFKGGIERAMKDRKFGSLLYFAMWQGLRGDDLDIDTTREYTSICTRFGTTVVFTTNVARLLSQPTELHS